MISLPTNVNTVFACIPEERRDNRALYMQKITNDPLRLFVFTTESLISYTRGRIRNVNGRIKNHLSYFKWTAQSLDWFLPPVISLHCIHTCRYIYPTIFFV